MRHRKLIIAAALLLLWTVGWFALRYQAGAEIDRRLADMASRGMVVLCPRRDVAGFPFSLEVGCARLVAHDGRSGLRVAAGPSAVRAGLAHPASIVADLGAPFTIRRGPDAATVRFDWTEARFVGGIGVSGARSARFDIRDGEGLIADRRLAFDSFTTDLEPASGGSLLSLEADDLSILHGEAGSTPLDVAFSAELSGSPASLASGRRLPSGFSAQNIELRAQTEGIVLAGNGRIGLNAGGLPDGAVTIRLVGIGALPGFIATLPQDLQPLANSAAGALMAFGRATMVDGSEAREIEVTIKAGLVSVGSVPLGRIGGL